MFPIERIPGTFPTRSWGSAYRDLVWALGMSDDFTLDFAGQAERAFAVIDAGLAQVGTDKTRLISVQVYLEDR
jgi:enamine deaminase RidA (YjgF/YER057c/UK114 family)